MQNEKENNVAGSEGERGFVPGNWQIEIKLKKLFLEFASTSLINIFHLIWFRLIFYFPLANNRFASSSVSLNVRLHLHLHFSLFLSLSLCPSVCLTFSWNVGQSMSSCFNIAHSIWKLNIAMLYKRTLYICMCTVVYIFRQYRLATSRYPIDGIEIVKWMYMHVYI